PPAAGTVRAVYRVVASPARGPWPTRPGCVASTWRELSQMPEADVAPEAPRLTGRLADREPASWLRRASLVRRARSRLPGSRRPARHVTQAVVSVPRPPVRRGFLSRARPPRRGSQRRCGRDGAGP